LLTYQYFLYATVIFFSKVYIDIEVFFVQDWSSDAMGVFNLNAQIP